MVLFCLKFSAWIFKLSSEIQEILQWNQGHLDSAEKSMHWKSYLSHQIHDFKGRNCTSAFDIFCGGFKTCMDWFWHTRTRVCLSGQSASAHHSLCPSPGRKASTWANPSRWTQIEPQLLPADPLVWITGLINMSIFFFQQPPLIHFLSWLFFLFSVCNISEIQNWYLKLWPVRLKKKTAFKW